MAARADNLHTITAYVSAAEARDRDALDQLLHPHVVYDVPQTRERVLGRAAPRDFNTAYPGEWHLELVERR